MQTRMSEGSNGGETMEFGDRIMHVIHKGTNLGTDFVGNLRRISDDMGTGDGFDNVLSYFASHPLTALFTIAMLVSCTLPIIFFIVFAVVTVLVTFTTFLLVEGTILAIGSVMLFGFIVAMLIVMLAMTAMVSVFYYGYVEFFEQQESFR